MTSNIVETIQKTLGYPPLTKMDPNIQETADISQRTVEEKLAQSTIPVVLAGFYKFTRTDGGCYAIIHASEEANWNAGLEINWMEKIFGHREEQAVEKVAQYAGVTKEEAIIDLEQASREVYKLLKDVGGEKQSPKRIKTYMNNQRHNILVYLPAVLQLGDLLNDNAMDDRTNKMEGPVSSFMHTIENKLSGGDS